MDGLYIVTFEALPLPGSQDAEACGGAYINVYVKESSESVALETASREVAEAGWHPQSIAKVVLVTREDFVADSDGLAYFEQAQIDGAVVVVHAFPNQVDEKDVRH